MDISIREASLEEFLQVLCGLPDFHEVPSITEARARIGNASVLCLLGELDGDVVGCKLGYSLDDESFYSWLGGVVPEHRRLGVAKSLLHYQEKWVEQQGYKYLRVKSMNHYPNMLRFLISEGYQIVDLEPGSPEKLKVHFQKQIKP